MSKPREEMLPALGTATIASGQSLSGAVEIAGYLMAGVTVPPAASWTTATVITFQVSLDNGATYNNLVNKDGQEYSVTITRPVATDPAFLLVNPADFGGFTHVKVRAGTAGTPVNQGADRVLQIGRMP